MNNPEGKNTPSFAQKTDIYQRAMNEIARCKSDSSTQIQGLSRLIQRPLNYSEVIAYVQGRA